MQTESKMATAGIKSAKGSINNEEKHNGSSSVKSLVKMTSTEKKKTFNHANLNEYLRGYYQFLFPHNLFYQWLSYGNVCPNYFKHREFSFTLAGDIYLRYNSFETVAEMRKSINTRLPVKIDIGAVYNIPPCESKKTKIFTFTAEERELVFDIDMTDYDDIRSCCQGADICQRCWPLMVIAARILDRFLRVDFGFQHLLWVYSGRRGIHCWVADERARRLKQPARDAIANFINIFDGGQFKAKKVEIDGNRGCHPSIREAVHIIDQYFDEVMVVRQDFLAKPSQIEQLINLVLDEPLRQALKQNLYSPQLKNTAERWHAFVAITQGYYRQIKGPRKYMIYRHRFLLEEVKLQLCYPRLDINVTKGLNHLLKVPFSVHPKTGRICVPIDFAHLDSFDPFTVPSVDELCNELDRIGGPSSNTVKDNCVDDEKTTTATNGNKDDDSSITSSTMGSSRLAERTTLAPSLAIFRSFIRGLETTQSGKLRALADQKLNF